MWWRGHWKRSDMGVGCWAFAPSWVGGYSPCLQCPTVIHTRPTLWWARQSTDQESWQHWAGLSIWKCNVFNLVMAEVEVALGDERNNPWEAGALHRPSQPAVNAIISLSHSFSHEICTKQGVGFEFFSAVNCLFKSTEEACWGSGRVKDSILLCLVLSLSLVKN